MTVSPSLSSLLYKGQVSKDKHPHPIHFDKLSLNFIEYIAFTITSMFQLLFYSAILTWISSKVDEHEQGLVMGGTVSIFGIAWAINAMLISPLVYISLFLPIYVAAFFFVLSGIIVLKVSYK